MLLLQQLVVGERLVLRTDAAQLEGSSSLANMAVNAGPHGCPCLPPAPSAVLPMRPTPSLVSSYRCWTA